MHKILSVSLVLGVFLGSTAISTNAWATFALESTQQQNKSLLDTILDKVTQTAEPNHEEAMESEKKASEQATNTEVLSRKNANEVQDATNVIGRETAQQESMVDTEKRLGNVDAYACSDISRSRNTSAYESYLQTYDALRSARLSERKTAADSGATQYLNELYDKMKTLGDNRYDIGELFANNNIPESGTIAANLNYLNQLLFNRVPVYSNKDLRENADTEMKNIITTSDRLNAEMQIGGNLLALLQAMRAPDKGGSQSKKSLEEIMKANGYSGEYIQKALGDKPSWRAVLEALTVGQMGQKYVEDRVVAKPENIQSGIHFQLMLNNMLLFEQFKLLETIAMATSANIIAVREEAIKDVNARIGRKNARQ